MAKPPAAPPVDVSVSRSDLHTGRLTTACDAMNRAAESPAERQMIPHLFCAVVGLLTLGDVDVVHIAQQVDIADVGRVDWQLILERDGQVVMVVLEVDGLAYHNGQEAFIKDRSRDRAALRGGYTTLRYAAIEVQQDGWSCGVDLHNTLLGLVSVGVAPKRLAAGELVAP